MNESPLYRMLEGLVDYAGLFPPAKLPMERTVTNFADYLDSPQAWMLGRLIVPVARLTEFEEVAGSLLPRTNSSEGWRISGLLPPTDAPATRDLSGAMREIESFNLRHAAAELGFARIDTVEVRCGNEESIDSVAGMLPPGITAFVELSVDEQLEQHVRFLATQSERLHAKIRTGGVTPDLIPDSAMVIEFVDTCVKNAVPFKATAGLHHPIRAQHALTYERDADVAFMHGFLNLLLATAGLVSKQFDAAAAVRLLEETSSGAITVDPTIGWQWGNFNFGFDEIQATRSRGLISFGSCSFIEPVEDLQALGHTLSLTTSH